MSGAQRDLEISRHFDGSARVSVPISSSGNHRDVLRVASWYGYGIVGESSARLTTTLQFQRDDTPAVRQYSLPFGTPPPPPAGPSGTEDPVIAARLAWQEANLLRLRRGSRRTGAAVLLLCVLGVVSVGRDVSTGEQPNLYIAAFFALMALVPLAFRVATGRRQRILDARAAELDRLATAPAPTPQQAPYPQQETWGAPAQGGQPTQWNQPAHGAQPAQQPWGPGGNPGWPSGN
ncbi:hypothetical protein [Allostreptomyces psammosilenae]|uniref:Uncharacterized protein n=1 Tax=Allostreptomyces psammosilenae TaxID=1892865 RepID=A0A852ZYT1_9ACTN|nr:hypothetical protein [Allostreptomyces psammosilenae]NYI05874.1 hypothetical protein [Allostreptomyces psammosilenae]